MPREDGRAASVPASLTGRQAFPTPPGRQGHRCGLPTAPQLCPQLLQDRVPMSNQGAVSIVGFPTAPGSHCPGPSSDSEPTPSLQSGLDGLRLAWDTEWEVPDPQQRATWPADRADHWTGQLVHVRPVEAHPTQPALPTQAGRPLLRALAPHGAPGWFLGRPLPDHPQGQRAVATGWPHSRLPLLSLLKRTQPCTSPRPSPPLPAPPPPSCSEPRVTPGSANPPSSSPVSPAHTCLFPAHPFPSSSHLSFFPAHLSLPRSPAPSHPRSALQPACHQHPR